MVVVLTVPDELRLWALVEDIGLDVAMFHEPDLNGELTAIATIAGDLPIFRRLSLLFDRKGGETNDYD